MISPSFPAWLHALAMVSLGLAVLCALFIAFDELRRPQPMWIMNLVWPLTALFGSILWLAAYLTWGRGPPKGAPKEQKPKPPFPAMVLKGASHCGAGCTLGDIVGEGLVIAAPAIAVAFGWGSLFGEKTFADWIFEFLLAFGFGVAFQYFTLAPMRHLGVKEGLLQALKADAASITAWQVGMYGGMALIQFGLWRPLYGAIAPSTTPEFWFAMQLAMLAGFATSYPVNWWLLRIGVKEAM
jgi:hypothetical protein